LRPLRTRGGFTRTAYLSIPGKVPKVNAQGLFAVLFAVGSCYPQYLEPSSAGREPESLLKFLLQTSVGMATMLTIPKKRTPIGPTSFHRWKEGRPCFIILVEEGTCLGEFIALGGAALRL
jgi:hypothetical protein